MFLVIIRWFSEINDTICVVTDTEENAQAWIDKEIEGNVSSGMGIHKIIPVKLI